MIPSEQHRSYLARQVGTLALAHVQSASFTTPLRAVLWHNALAKLSLHLPLIVVHDFGLLMTASAGGTTISIAPRGALLEGLQLSSDQRGLLRRYHSLLEAVAESEVTTKASGWRLRDDLVAVLLSRVLGDLYHRWGDPTKATGAQELPIDPPLYQDLDLGLHFLGFERQSLWDFLRFLIANQLHLYTCVEQIDLDTLRLLGLLPGNALQNGLNLLDLYGIFQSPEASGVVTFSLDLLPSVLETKRASATQTFAIDGYASIERRGELDSLILTEIAHDDDLLEQKIVDDELYYYGHEKQRKEKRRLQYILIDSSPSMRGVRQIFARGLALTLAKKFALAGDETWLRFFDSRLHDTQKVSNLDFAAPYLLSFRSERGRNYGKVFRQLLTELGRLRQEEGRQVVVYILTHGQCHLPVELVQQLAREALLYGIFVLPSSDFAPEYLNALHRHQVVDEAALSSQRRRKERALDIIADTTAGPRFGSSP